MKGQRFQHLKQVSIQKVAWFPRFDFQQGHHQSFIFNLLLSGMIHWPINSSNFHLLLAWTGSYLRSSHLLHQKMFFFPPKIYNLACRCLWDLWGRDCEHKNKVESFSVINLPKWHERATNGWALGIRSTFTDVWKANMTILPQLVAALNAKTHTCVAALKTALSWESLWMLLMFP